MMVLVERGWWPPRRGDVWGGFTAMLVALPSAIAFGVTVFSGIGPDFVRDGALAGIIGAVLIALIAAWLGGTDRLISAPCAPAAAVLAAFAVQMMQPGEDPNLVVLMLVIIGVLAGITQVLLGLLGVGRLIKYIPYPVVSGYLTGVGLIIIASQVRNAFGVPGNMTWWNVLLAPHLWDWRALAIAAVTALAAAAAPRLTTRVPATIIGIAAGIAVYFGLALDDPGLRVLEGNVLVLGQMDAAHVGLIESFIDRWRAIGQMNFHHVIGLLGSAVTLAALLSIDTLKTCVVLDKLTHSRHNSDRELIAQGWANMASSACGGISGAGTVGATMIGLNSGSQTRAVGVMQGLFALVAALMLGPFLAWIPQATLAGILIRVGVRMIDREPLRFLQSRTTRLDFAVVAAVVITATTVGLIAASAVGVGLAMLLFVRAQSGASPVRHKLELSEAPSNWHRPEPEMQMLANKASEAVIFELQGNLFFGNTYQLYADLENEIRTRRFVIIDFRRVSSIDVTAAEVFSQVRNTIQERGARLVLCGIADDKNGGRTIRKLLTQVGVLDPNSATVRVFPNRDLAIAYVEDRLLRGVEIEQAEEAPMPMRDMDLFSGYTEETLQDLEAVMTVRRFNTGDIIFAFGSPGDALFWVRKGAVRLVAPLGYESDSQLAGFGRGDYFGALAFLDQKPHPDAAIAFADTEVYVLSREDFDRIALKHRKFAFNLATAIARSLAKRLRRTQLKLIALEEH